LRILIWLLIGIGYMAYYLQLRRKFSQNDWISV
jgi:hypothetical protein